MNFRRDGSMTAFWVVNNQFQKFIDSKFTLDYNSQMTDTYFVEYTGIEVQHFKDTLLQHLGNVKKSVAERTQSIRQDTQQCQMNNIGQGMIPMLDDADIRPYNDEGPMAEACSFMLCDLDFEPLSLSLSSLPSCDLMSLTNMLILLHYLESFKSEFAEVFKDSFKNKWFKPLTTVSTEVFIQESCDITTPESFKLIVNNNLNSTHPLSTLATGGQSPANGNFDL
ncbi:hypothetical protein Tco_0000038 [Tanacetum coccineum]